MPSPEMITKGIILLLKSIARLRKRHVTIPDDIRDVLLVETTRLGDVIALLPVIPRFQQRFPNARITLAVSERFAPLGEGLTEGLDILPLNDAGDVATSLRSIHAVRSRRYDLSCSMSPSRRNALFTLASRSRYSIGYLEARNSVTPFLESTPVTGVGCEVEMQAPFSGLSIYQRPHLVANAVRAPKDRQRGPCSLRADVARTAMERLRAQGLPPERPFVLIHPFALWEYRTWDVGAAAQLARMIVDGLGLRVVVIGGKADFLGVRSANADMFVKSGAVVLASDDLRDSTALISHARLLIGTDSGPLHLAAAIGIPVIGLYGPATPRLTAPPHAAGTILYHQLPCSPCMQRSCSSPANSCMSKHLPEDVYAAVSQLVRDRTRVVANA